MTEHNTEGEYRIVNGHRVPQWILDRVLEEWQAREIDRGRKYGIQP